MPIETPTQSHQQPKRSLVAFGLNGIGALFLSIVIFLIYQDQTITSKFPMVTGMVIEMRYDNEGMSSPTIQYSWHEISYLHLPSSWSDPPSYEVGEQVELFVNPDNPAEAKINTFFQRYFLAFILLVFGIIFMGVGIHLFSKGKS